MLTGASASREEYGLLDYWSIVRKRWLWVLLPVVVLAAGSVYYSSRQPLRYDAEATVILADTASQATLDPSSQNTGFLSRELSNEISLAHSDAVEDLVEAELGSLPGISISAENGADVLVFAATADSPEAAATVANTWARKYIQVKREAAVRDITAATVNLQQRLQGQREQRQQLRAPLDELDERIQQAADPETAARLQREYDRLADDLSYELDLLTSQAEATVANLTDLELRAELSAVGEARFVQVAAPPEASSNPPMSRNLALGVVLGLIVGFGLAMLAEARDQTIKSAADIEAVIDLPVLSSIPLASKKQQGDLAIATHRDPEGIFADGYHKVRSALEFAAFDRPLKSVLITSPSAAEGKSTTSSNLALALSSVGNRTVLIDVDYRRPTIHRVFNVAQSPGLSDVSLYGAEIGSVAYAIQEPGLQDLLVMPTGTVPPSPAAFVGASGFLGTLDRIRAEADMMVMDAPPMLAVSDAHTLSRWVDAVLLTARAGQTTKGELAEVVKVLGQVGANVLGVVLIGVEEADTYGKLYYRSETRPVPVQPAGRTDLWDDPAQAAPMPPATDGSRSILDLTHSPGDGSVPSFGPPTGRG